MKLRGIFRSLLNNGMPMAIHDYTGHKFTTPPKSLELYKLDRTSFLSLYNIGHKNYRLANFTGADLSGITVRSSDFSHANFTNATPPTFFGCILNGAIISDDADLKHCSTLFTKFTTPLKLETKSQKSTAPDRSTNPSFVHRLFGDHNEGQNGELGTYKKSITASAQLAIAPAPADKLKQLFAHAQQHVAAAGEQKCQEREMLRRVAKQRELQQKNRSI